MRPTLRGRTSRPPTEFTRNPVLPVYMVLQPIRFIKANAVTHIAGGLLHLLFTIAGTEVLWHSKFLQHYLSTAYCNPLPALFTRYGALRCPDFPPCHEDRAMERLHFFCKNSVIPASKKNRLPIKPLNSSLLLALRTVCRIQMKISKLSSNHPNHAGLKKLLECFSRCIKNPSITTSEE